MSDPQHLAPAPTPPAKRVGFLAWAKSNWIVSLVVGAAVTTGVGAGVTRLVSGGGSTGPSGATVASCMRAHGLDEAHEHSEEGGTTVFHFCDAPAPRYAGDDGYTEIEVRSVQGPGASEATDESVADRVEPSDRCSEVQLTYTVGFQGDFNHRSFVVHPGTVYTSYGEEWSGPKTTLPFYPSSSEAVVLHNLNNVLDSARCLAT